MRNEKGEILEALIVVIAIIITIAMITMIVILIKNDIEYGTKEGIVIDKNYTAAYTTIRTTGKLTFPEYNPEKYSIKIQKEVKGNNKSIWINVDQITYHNLNIGDYYGYHE